MFQDVQTIIQQSTRSLNDIFECLSSPKPLNYKLKMNITHLKQSHFNFTIAPNLFVMQKKCIVPGLPNAPLQLTITMITQP